MKKTMAFLMFAGIALFLGGYAAWTMRVFYTDAEMEIDRRLPLGAVEGMLKWEKENDFLKPQPFSWGEAFGWLKNPWRVDTRKAGMRYLNEPYQVRTEVEVYYKIEGYAWIFSSQNGMAKFLVEGGGCRFKERKTRKEFDASM